jgi:hypothetical protein
VLPVIAQLHAAAAIGLVVFSFAVAGLAAFGGLARRDRVNSPLRPDRRTLDRAILAVLGLASLGLLTGLWELAAGSRPSDQLHYLYALVAVLILPVARFAGPGWWARNRAIVVSVAGVILIGIAVRLAQTGG